VPSVSAMNAHMQRRDFLRLTGSSALAAMAAGVLAGCGDAFSSGDSGPSTGRKVKLGFIALTDCAPLVVAKAKGYFAELDLDVEIVKQASWPATRDNLLTGAIDGAHCLHSMPTSIAAGISGTGTDLRIAMMLSQNGQAITLKNDLVAAGHNDLAAAKAVLDGKPFTFAMTYPGGTHDMWLRYWLRATGADLSKAKIIPIPPPQMVANMKASNMDGYSVGEPWNGVAVAEDIGFTVVSSQDLWKHHPEKALVVSPQFRTERAAVLEDVMVAILKASAWMDDVANRAEIAALIAPTNYVNTKAENIAARLKGDYEIGAGLPSRTYTDDFMMFHRGGLVNKPRRSHVIWNLAQYKRLGMVTGDLPYAQFADELIIPELYDKAAQRAGVTVPDDDMTPIEGFIDGVVFDPTKPDEEANRP